MVVVDLFTRETMLCYLRYRNQDNVAKALIKNIIFQRGVPASLRTDNAPELSSTTGAVSAVLSKLHKYSTQPAAHSQDTNTGRSKGGRW